ncbi:MAG TPA: isoleucine--tRNA ligase [Sandaracinaceae bacterium LLY-WYZ-13_1]|nr:isoleucine--tRNA ligase [Sandaracinaceae bacterium LLY-WYZ-13_1]
MFDPVSQGVSFPELEEELLAFWEEARIFEKSVEEAKDRPRFVFYEGPPTANGMPHPGHVLTRVMKDVVLRYRTMTGYHVPRRAGWDTHGLPVEVEVEKELGISGRPDIEAYGVEAFSRRCVQSVFQYIGEWRRMTRRIAFWVDLDAAYVTFHKSYVESVWWALKTLFDKGLLYQDYKVVWWWPQGGTALSSGEVGQGYKEVDDPSVIVRFAAKDEENTSFLAWTTTPWTLPSNVALAVAADEPYATVRMPDGERLILAEALVEKVLGEGDHEIVATRAGRELVGARYEAPFDYATPEGGDAHVVVDADFVSLDTGSGLVHIAPAFGEDDFRVAKEKGLGFLQLVQPDGTFPPEVTDFAGRFCKEADRDIIRLLRQRGALLHEESYRHEYPFCWRKMDDPLIQYARRSWFIKTTREIDRVIENNQRVHWEPGHIKDGRFGEFLRSNVDWALSRERFWGTPLPIWINDETGDMVAVGSTAELLERNPDAFAHFEAARAEDESLVDDLMVHKPWIDQVTFTVEGEPGVYRRVSEVIDCWFDSGCMPFAQHGYPHRNRALFEEEFPADFITEALDQTRGWFYSLIAISTMLFEDEGYPHPYRNCTVLGLLTAGDGKKLSKSLKNYRPPQEMFDRFGADAVRWSLYVQSLPGQSAKWFDGGANDAVKDFLLKIWNVYSFFVTYASIDGWDPQAARPPVAERPDLDRWILAELDATVRDVRAEMDAYRTHPSARRLADFVDALSNWYVRRSRARFWAKGESTDKTAAFATLYEVLVDLSKTLAPFTPFLAEQIYQNLARRGPEGSKDSVHLDAFVEPTEARRDDALRAQMEAARDVVALGQRVRASHKLKVRQPLGEAIVVVASDEDRATVERFSDAIRDELNIEALSFTDEPQKYVTFSMLPNFRVLGPKIGKKVPLVKKALASADGGALYQQLEDSGEVTVELDDGPLTLGADEIEIRLEAKEDFAAASHKGRVVVLDTRITDELKRAGLAREAVNRIQRARKDMDLPFEARIEVAYEASGELAKALEEHGVRIAEEVLATELASANGEPGGTRHETEVEGEPFVFWIETRGEVRAAEEPA